MSTPKDPVIEQLEGALETSMENLASDQAAALNATLAGDTDAANAALAGAHVSADVATRIATVLIEESERTD